LHEYFADSSARANLHKSYPDVVFPVRLLNFLTLLTSRAYGQPAPMFRAERCVHSTLSEARSSKMTWYSSLDYM
jgi:hypothetical protein